MRMRSTFSRRSVHEHKGTDDRAFLFRFDLLRYNNKLGYRGGLRGHLQRQRCRPATGGEQHQRLPGVHGVCASGVAPSRPSVTWRLASGAVCRSQAHRGDVPAPVPQTLADRSLVHRANREGRSLSMSSRSLAIRRSQRSPCVPRCIEVFWR